MTKLKNLRPSGYRTDNVLCGLVHPFRNEYVVGCGKGGSLENFYYDLDSGTVSSVAFCPACAAKQMTHSKSKVPNTRSTYALFVGETRYGAAWPDEEDGVGWMCRVSVADQEYLLWAPSLREAQVDALVWYRHFTKGVK